jgi:hypothetical protein
MADSLLEVAMVDQLKGQYQEAEGLFRQALDIRRGSSVRITLSLPQA